ncbi:MAG: hypothetical protein L3J07_03015 [Candidatus Magasanikbacteria bacterium]|nr:hypothetical protein [Candidatus Magasanikbacteria bacterium]
MCVLVKLFVSLFLLTSCGAGLEVVVSELKIETPKMKVQGFELVCGEGTEQKFSENKVFLENRCERKNNIWHGKRRVYYLNGQLYIDSTFCEGKLCRIWKTYYESGMLKSDGLYKKGKPNGIWTTYYKNGNKFSSGKFRDGCKDGIWYFYDENENKIVKIFADAKTCRSEVVEKYERGL